MNGRQIVNMILTALLFIVMVIVIVDCQGGSLMAKGGISLGSIRWHWDQILVSLAVGFLAGFLTTLYFWGARKS